MAYLQSLRLISPNLLLSNVSRTLINHPVRSVTIKAAQIDFKRAIPKENHEDRNERLGRPQSPHLTIYKPQLTSVLSLMHRGSGVVLSAYIWTLGIGCLTSDFSTIYDKLVELNISPAVVLLGKLALAGPITYHCINGIRHLSWDIGKFLTIKDVYTTGYIVLLVTAVALGYLLYV